jgi:hypothetical protein
MMSRENPYYDKLEAAGHKLRRDEDGDIDFFVMDIGYHNGPGCTECGHSWCEHCEDAIEPCIGREETERRAKESRRDLYERLRTEFEGTSE